MDVGRPIRPRALSDHGQSNARDRGTRALQPDEVNDPDMQI
jgi:hypothetical protein